MGNEYIKKKTKFQQKKRQNFKTKKKKSLDKNNEKNPFAFLFL